MSGAQIGEFGKVIWDKLLMAKGGSSNFWDVAARE